jgi:flavin-dependent dehydrogenase
MPAGVRRLAALGVAPDGRPLRGIRYLDATHRADALFASGHGLGVRRTALNAALSARAAELGIRVIPVRVTAFEQHADHVTAAGLAARYLVAADGLHSTIRRILDRGALGAGRGAPAAAPRRYGLRQHFRVVPWTDLVEVHWSQHSEAYVTPVAPDVAGVALLFASGPGPAGACPSRDGQAGEGQGRERGDLTGRLAAFPELAVRLADAAPASVLRGAGPMRQDVRRRVYGRVLLVGDASGYVDALTGEGLGVGLAQADALASCLAAGRPADYERAWHRASGTAWRFTSGLLWARHQPLLGPRLVPLAQRLPWLFTALVNHAADS